DLSRLGPLTQGRSPSHSLYQRPPPLLAEFLDRLAGHVLPQVCAVLPRSHRPVELLHRLLVVLLDHVGQEPGGHPVAAVVPRLLDVEPADLPRLVLEEPDVVGDALDQPARVATPAVELHAM